MRWMGLVTFPFHSQIEDLSNKVGNYFKSKGYQQNDTIALLMETRMEYSSMWLGLSKIGVITALINFNLRKETLVHSIRIASSKAIIVSAELLDALIEIITDDEISKLHIFVYDDKSADVKPLNGQSVNLHQALKETSEPRDSRKPQ
jgi:solute carrier family 27 (fatty acid transporter), member 1/4